MSSMRPAVIIILVLVLMVLLAGCGQRVPTRNATGKNPWASTPTQAPGQGTTSTVVPTPTSPFIEATLIPTGTATMTPAGAYRAPPPPENLTANFTLLDEKNLVFVYNRTAFNFHMDTPPLLIEYTLTVPNVTKTRIITDPVSGGDKLVSITYPDPVAFFEVAVRDLETKRIIAREGYGGQYDVSYTKEVWIRYPGDYYIEFWGNRVTANIKFRGPGQQ